MGGLQESNEKMIREMMHSQQDLGKVKDQLNKLLKENDKLNMTNEQLNNQLK